jgi:hypothetical protein
MEAAMDLGEELRELAARHLDDLGVIPWAAVFTDELDETWPKGDS